MYGHRALRCDRIRVMKTCPTCKQTKSLSEFGKNKAKKDGLQSQCNECRKEANKKYYLNTPERNVQRRAFTARRVAENQSWVLEYLLSHPCVDCEITDVRVLEFDHVRGAKSFNISESFWRNPVALQKEVAKCDVRCANCHRIVTQQRLTKHYKNMPL